MSIARFYSRISNALGPLVGSSSLLEEFLSKTAVALYASQELELHPSHKAGFLIATNLFARLYPRIHIIASESLTDECASLALSINPACEIERREGSVDASLVWGHRYLATNPVTVSAENWNVHVDDEKSERMTPTNMLTALAAGVIGVSEVFRTVFSRFLSPGRKDRDPVTLNLLTLGEDTVGLPNLPEEVVIGRVHLVGAGAIGQAMVYALSALQVKGSLVVVDPEVLSISNLQRYILSTDEDVAKSKCDVVARVLAKSGLEVIKSQVIWGEDPEIVRLAENVCVAVDSAGARIDIQASLPRRIYNAWTQPADIGWTRHEHFGEDPCLACLYMPVGSKPSLHELISRAIRQAAPRVLAYLLFKQPVDTPLQINQVIMLQPQPNASEIGSWSNSPILDDIAQEFKLDPEAAAFWKGKQITDLYREGICGGAIITDLVAEVPQEVAVPLAHQSVLAGIMLATQLIVAVTPQLRHVRSHFPEGRINLLASLKQMVGRPRERTPGCICGDSDFVDRYHEKWRSP
jgi:ThiF family